MKAVVQRVRNATVTVNEMNVGSIETGLLIYLGVARDDDESDVTYIAEKTVNLRIFEDDNGRMNLSVKDTEGEILVISQFTLIADTRKGRRPYFGEAAPPEKAEKLYQQFVRYLTQCGIMVHTGVFGEQMMVDYVNEGPVTILLDSSDRK